MIWDIVSAQPPTLGSSMRTPLPKLVRSGSGPSPNGIGPGAAGSVGAQSWQLDVVRDFYWTYSKPESREEVPTIFLKEKTLKVNALVSQLKYSLGFAAREGQAAINTLQAQATRLIGATSHLYKDVASTIQSGVNLAAGGAQVVAGAADTISQEIRQLIADDENTTMQTSPWLQPYNGLYITKDTGWEFLFPYFNDKFDLFGNTFSSEGATNALAGLVGGAANIPMEIAEIAGSIANPTQITYIERAKFFNYPTDGEEVSFTFPLINTGSVSYQDVVNNWQLIFLLLYNNKPGRLSPTQIEQPVIYEVEIPGVKFMPFCFISSIDVQFQGSRRQLPINLSYAEQQTAANPQGAVQTVFTATGTKTITTVVPDAYVVTITLKSMLGSTKNFLFHLIDRSDRTRVGVRNATPVRPAVPSTGEFVGDINTTAAANIA